MSCRRVFPGQRYGHWLVVEGNERRSYDRVLLHKCVCDCGKVQFHPGGRLLQNKTTMCIECYLKQPMHKGMRVFEDITGQVFGKWTVIGRGPNKPKSKSAQFICRCECGREATKTVSAIKNQKKKMCVACMGARRKGKCNAQWKGYEEIPGKYLTRCKRQAESRNLEYSVTDEFLWNLYIAQNRKCALSGVPIAFGNPSVGGGNTASLDRIDSQKGYTEANVQWIHYKINPMKMAMPQDEFIEWAKRIAACAT